MFIIQKYNKQILFILILGLCVTILAYMSSLKNPLILASESVQVELGDSLQEPSKYLTGDILSHIDEVKMSSNMKDEIGKYTVHFQYKKHKKDMTVEVVDTTQPVFNKAKEKLTYYAKNKPSHEELISQYSATDLTPVTITVDDSLVNYNKVGDYKAIVKALDSSKNETTKEITISIVQPSIKMNTQKKTVSVDESFTLKTTVKGPKNQVKYQSNNTAVATVTETGKVTAKKPGSAIITASANGVDTKCNITVKAKPVKVPIKTPVKVTQQSTNTHSQQKKPTNTQPQKPTNTPPKNNATVENKTYKVSIPTVSQHKNGYPKGCEGVSLYMALKGKGYLSGVSLDSFMASMPRATDNPNLGYVGDPTGKDKAGNAGKRTTIHPKPVCNWISSKYTGNIHNLQGADVSRLKKELRAGHPCVVWVTSGWNTPKWKTYSWGRTVSNNHALCLVGYNESKGYLINDCGSHLGEYWVSKAKFEKCYNARKYAVSIS